MSTLEGFFQQLTWKDLKAKVDEALKYPNSCISSTFYSPASTDSLQEVARKIVDSALNRSGEIIKGTSEEKDYDKNLVIIRVLEAIMILAEEYEQKVPTSYPERSRLNLPLAQRNSLEDFRNRHLPSQRSEVNLGDLDNESV